MKSGNNISRWSWQSAIVVLYLLLCGLYFAPIAAPHKLFYPLLLLTLCSLRHRSPLLTLAFACSALGDLFGSLGTLLPQIGAFAMAQLCYILTLRRLVPKVSLRSILLAAVLPAVLCLVTYIAILPTIGAPIIKFGVVGYSLLIGAMVAIALLTGRQKVGLGAALFVLSDLLLAFLIFLAPNHTLQSISLVLYFAGQLLLWLGITESLQQNS